MKKLLLIVILALGLAACATPTPEIILVDRDTGEIITEPEPREQPDCQDRVFWEGIGNIYVDMGDALSAMLDADDTSDAAIKAIVDSQERGLRQMQALTPPACAVHLRSLQVQQLEYFLEFYLAMLDGDYEAADYWWEQGESLDPQIDAEWDKIEAEAISSSYNGVSY